MLCTALLRNIAFESDTYRMEVKSCGGVEALLAVSRIFVILKNNLL